MIISRNIINEKITYLDYERYKVGYGNAKGVL